MTLPLRALGYTGTGILYAHANCEARAKRKAPAKAATGITVTVPPRFHADRASRDLPVGETVIVTSRGVTIHLSVEDARDYLQDARHYSGDAFEPSDLPPGLRASARASLAVLSAALGVL